MVKNFTRYRNITRLAYALALVFTAGLFQSYISTGLLLVTILGGAFFCGWLCPFGAIQELGGVLGRKILRKRFRLPVGIHKYLQYLRFLLYFVLPLFAGFLIIYDPQYSMQAVLSGHNISLALWSVLLFFFVFSFFVERPFCNYFCLQGALYGMQGFFRVFRIKRDKKTCIDCKVCDKFCPMNIEISTNGQVNNINCINCFECIERCPKNSLSYGPLKLR